MALHIYGDEMSYNVICKNAINFQSTGAEKAEPKVLIVDQKDKAPPDEFQRFLMENVPSELLEAARPKTEQPNVSLVIPYRTTAEAKASEFGLVGL